MQWFQYFYFYIVNGTKRKEDNGVPPSSKWETFDDETACNNEPTAAPVPKPRRIPSEPVPSDISNRADHDALEYSVPLHKKLEDPSTRRTPPPLPKPYEKKNENITSKSNNKKFLFLFSQSYHRISYHTRGYT